MRARPGCEATARAMADIAIGSSCPPAVAERVRNCIMHSGRYDCRVSAGAAFFLVSSRLVADCGGSVTITDDLGPEGLSRIP